MPLFCYIHHEYVCYETCHCSVMYIMNMYTTRHSHCSVIYIMNYVCYKTCHCSVIYIMNMYAMRHAIVLLCASWIFNNPCPPPFLFKYILRQFESLLNVTYFLLLLWPYHLLGQPITCPVNNSKCIWKFWYYEYIMFRSLNLLLQIIFKIFVTLSFNAFFVFFVTGIK